MSEQEELKLALANLRADTTPHERAVHDAMRKSNPALFDECVLTQWRVRRDKALKEGKVLIL